jgi:ubiquinone biosynthesis monooxygenase Coq7
MNHTDTLICAFDDALRTLFAKPRASRPIPAQSPIVTHATRDQAASLSPAEARLSCALMRVNHVGEICAQALYSSQRLATQNPKLKTQFSKASAEEVDHLAWTQKRIEELGGHTSYLNPLWYAGAFAIGYGVGKLGQDPLSLGFVVETERQVETHLASHLDRLPSKDKASRAIVAQMQKDEIQHAQDALKAGAQELPQVVKTLMKGAAKVMTTVAHHI